MHHNLSCNILLGRPWIHAINGLPSTLHRSMKYIYNNKVYTLKANPKSENRFEAGMTNPLSTLTPTTKVEPLRFEDKDESLLFMKILLVDYWESLDFTPTFMGDTSLYNQNQRNRKKQQWYQHNLSLSHQKHPIQ